MRQLHEHVELSSLARIGWRWPRHFLEAQTHALDVVVLALAAEAAPADPPLRGIEHAQ